MITVGQAFACSEKKDHVFAMIGLSTNYVDKNARANSSYFPKPDYGLSVDEVFTRATLWSLIDRQSLSVLSLSCKRDAGSTLPSWVPDLSTLEPIGYISHDGSGFFQAGGSSKPVIDVVNQRILRLDGYVVDHVDSLLPFADLPPIQAELLTKNKDGLPVDFLRWLGSCEAFATGSASGLTNAQFETFWCTMTRDCDAIGERASSDQI
ncbi:hypothetical protein QQX98_009725 [Neonectria punicea]|uniref:Uncharacterized protein n=1 Tax=Neonectria punicea TaxID=979145 RepID=A0ABR1GRV8_9HYPO